jgi:hypothetical protein
VEALGPEITPTMAAGAVADFLVLVVLAQARLAAQEAMAAPAALDHITAPSRQLLPTSGLEEVVVGLEPEMSQLTVQSHF